MFYTVDQVAACLALSENQLRESYLWWDGHDSGAYHPRFLRAVNIKPLPGSPDWRVAEAEFVRWLKFHNLHLYDAAELVGTSERVAYEAALHSARMSRAYTESAPEPPHPNQEKPDADLLAL